MRSRSVPASAASTSASSEPDGTSSPSARRTPTAEQSSPDTGPESPALRTFAKSHRGALENDSDKWTETAVSPTLNSNEFHSEVRTPVPVQSLAIRGREGGAMPELAELPNLRTGSGGSSKAMVLISSAGAPPAKTSASLADEPDSSRVSAQACSSSSPGSPMSLFGQEDGCCLRTFPDYFPALEELEQDETSQSYSRRWPTSGFTTSPGECWTAAISECPNGGDASTSLPDVLLETVPDRFFLSQLEKRLQLRLSEKLCSIYSTLYSTLVGKGCLRRKSERQDYVARDLFC